MTSKSRSEIVAKDLVAMALLRTKYWGLFSDIQHNRDLYTQIRPEDSRFALLLSDDEDRKYRKAHFDKLFEKLNYSEEDVDLLVDVLNGTFPGWRHDNHQNEDALREDSRIGHRDLLDLYFAYSLAQNTFAKHMEQVLRVIGHLEKYNERQLTRVLLDFNSYAAAQESPADVSRLLVRRLHRQKTLRSGSEVMSIWRIWLRTLLQNKIDDRGSVNSLMASVLSGSSEAIQRLIPVNAASTATMNKAAEQRVELSRMLFDDVVKHLKDPYAALLMLLFILPASGNRFFEDYMPQGRVELFEPVLSYVDDFFITQGRNIFKDYKWPEYQFILYQWSLSIDTDRGEPNKAILNSEIRHRLVNDYVFSLLRGNPKQTYEFIRQQFWSNNGWSSEDYEWRVGSKIAQYRNDQDMSALRNIALGATRSARLTSGQKEELREFIDVLARYGLNQGERRDIET